MEISPGIRIINNALFIEKEKGLVIGDVHIGMEEALNKEGIFVPRFQFSIILDAIKKIFEETGFLDKIIINGDLKHEFGRISEQEWRDTIKFIDVLSKNCREIILVKGNHDTILGPIAKKRNVQVVDYYILGKVAFCHGDRIIKSKDFNQANKIIISHEHPAVSLKDGARIETYKCFLRGLWKQKTLIVIPSFSLVSEGLDVCKEEVLSPFLKRNLKDFDVFISADTVYKFGKLGKLKKI